MQLDWVCNEDTYGLLAVSSVPNGTISMFPLTYPRFVVNELITGAALGRLGSAFPEGEKQYVKAVRGHIGLAMSSWAAGNSMNLFFRIVKKTMDTGTGGAITDGAYALDDVAFANERFAWQDYIFDTFTAGTATKSMVRVKATVNQWLEPDEALYLAVQNESGASNSVQVRLLLRTLMKAES